MLLCDLCVKEIREILACAHCRFDILHELKRKGSRQFAISPCMHMEDDHGARRSRSPIDNGGNSVHVVALDIGYYYNLQCASESLNQPECCSNSKANSSIDFHQVVLRCYTGIFLKPFRLCAEFALQLLVTCHDQCTNLEI